MKYFVLEKTKYLLTNSWIGLLIPAGVHQLINNADKSLTSPPEKQQSSFRAHPAETRMTRSSAARIKP